MLSRTCWPLISLGLLVVVPVIMMAAAGPAGAQDGYKPHHAINPKNPQVYFDISIGDKPAGRIEMELFADACPRPPRTSAPCAPARRAAARAASPCTTRAHHSTA